MSEQAGNKPTLMDDFGPADPAEWRALVESQLKGAPFDKKVVTQTPEEISLQPIYTRQSVQALDAVDSYPGLAPYLRGNQVSGYKKGAWEVAQALPLSSAEAFHQAIISDLQRGQTGVCLRLDEASRNGGKTGEVGKGGTVIRHAADFQTAIDGLDPQAAPLHLEAGLSTLAMVGMLQASSLGSGESLKKMCGSLGYDPVGFYAENGFLPASLDGCYHQMAELVRWCGQNAPQLRAVGIHLEAYGNAGGSAVDELACMLATAAEYMEKLIDRGIPAELAARSLRVSLGIGSNFFMEIAKFRVARALWSFLIEAYEVPSESARLCLHAVTLEWNKTLYDPYVNLLRSCTEAFSASLGGCESMELAPFDALFGEPDEFSRRISRNQQTVLAEEAHLTEVIDPAGGSWYIETLTRQLGEKAWARFQEIQSLGGMSQAVRMGDVQSSIHSTADLRRKALSHRKSVMVGTNMYANLQEKKPESRSSIPPAYEVPAGRDELAVQEALAGLDSRANLFATLKTAAEAGATVQEINHCLYGNVNAVEEAPPLQTERLTEAYEALRRNTEAMDEPPSILLANMGPVPQHKLRSDFAAEFLAPSGFTILRDHQFDSPEDAADQAVASGALAAVICSTDDTYPELVPVFARRIKEQKPELMVSVAGMLPEHEAAFREAGVDDFIHLRANNLEFLQNLQRLTGVSS